MMRTAFDLGCKMWMYVVTLYKRLLNPAVEERLV